MQYEYEYVKSMLTILCIIHVYTCNCLIAKVSSTSVIPLLNIILFLWHHTFQTTKIQTLFQSKLHFFI